MSEQENTRLVSQAYELIRTGDIPAFLELLAEDVQWRVPRMEHVPFAGTWEGREGVGKFFRIVADVQDVLEFEPEQYVAQGERVVVLGHFRMCIKSGGIPVESDWAHAWVVRDGKVARFTEYVDTAAVSRAHTEAAHRQQP